MDHPEYVRTLQNPTATIEGVPVYGDLRHKLTLLPAPPDTGIVFRMNGKDIPCSPKYLSPPRGKWTSLVKGRVIVHDTEHIIAALRGMEVDNCIIDIEAREAAGVPVLDGSAKQFADEIHRTGTVEQDRPRQRFILGRGGVAMIMPSYKGKSSQERRAYLFTYQSDCMDVSYALDYEPLKLGKQSMCFSCITPELFRAEIAPARTFLTRWEVERYAPSGPEQMWGHAIYDMPIISETETFEERMPNEACRHKILDIIGDIGLLGPFSGWVLGIHSGHTLNRRMVRAQWTSALP